MELLEPVGFLSPIVASSVDSVANSVDSVASSLDSVASLDW